MKHYKWVEFLSNFRMSSCPEQTQSPSIENFLATVLVLVERNSLFVAGFMTQTLASLRRILACEPRVGITRNASFNGMVFPCLFLGTPHLRKFTAGTPRLR